jgi:hypothetical protein
MMGPSHHFFRTRINAQSSPKIASRERMLLRNFIALDYYSKLGRELQAKVFNRRGRQVEQGIFFSVFSASVR